VSWSVVPKLLSSCETIHYSTYRHLARGIEKGLSRFSEFEKMHKSATRRYARFRTEIPIIVKLLGKDGYVRIHGRCFEIAEAGLGAVITSELTAGEMVTLEFSIPDVPEALVIRSVVRHRMGFLHGFEFIGALPAQSELIQAFCQTLEPS
jgi:PilZ domain